jgi:hypothetical protein
MDMTAGTLLFIIFFGVVWCVLYGFTHNGNPTNRDKGKVR